MTPDRIAVRQLLQQDVRASRREVVEIARRLVARRSDTPPGDTRGVADEIAAIMSDIGNVTLTRHPGAEHVMNLVLRLPAQKPGRRLVFNGHMDTFPLSNEGAWTADPHGEEREGRLYGLGISDMKGGLAAILFALRRLSAHMDALSGEVVATFAGDEETMGVLGTKLLLDSVPEARGDAMISGDAGSPRVLRFGEKGMLWLSLEARGRSAHAAHVHRGDSAIDKLVAVIARLGGLRDFPVSAPPAVLDAIAASSEISESLSGTGESDVLRRVTITFGTIRGGTLSNLIPDHAEASADVRVPVGVSLEALESEIFRIVGEYEGVNVTVHRRYAPSWTDPHHEVIRTLAGNCEATLGVAPVLNMRVGASDARLYRAAGVPTVVCGLTPANMGAPDEYVHVDELTALGEIFALTAFDYLARRRAGGHRRPEG